MYVGTLRVEDIDSLQRGASIRVEQPDPGKLRRGALCRGQRHSRFADELRSALIVSDPTLRNGMVFALQQRWWNLRLWDLWGRYRLDRLWRVDGKVGESV